MYKTLVLNADFTPIRATDWQKAMMMLFKDSRDNKDGTFGAAFLISDYDYQILDSAGRKYNIPAVVALKRYVKVNPKVGFSRIAILARDNFQCQYCGVVDNHEDLTIDHIIPRSKWKKMGYSGSPSTFTNVVTACSKCNKHKADFLLSERGMKLLKQPKELTRSQIFLNKIRSTKIPKEWEPFLESTNNEQAQRTSAKQAR
jgi:5-methylcytosine-specific restriction endonuclease McrA